MRVMAQAMRSVRAIMEAQSVERQLNSMSRAQLRSALKSPKLSKIVKGKLWAVLVRRRRG